MDGMADETQQAPQEQNSDTIFQDAINALRRGDKPRAKELLTLLLKTDQNNPTYWIWLSVSVDAQKERIYCLQTALKLDPENATAKRGLILLGALSPDETIQPFPMNRPRAWEENLLLAHEKPKERGIRAIVRSPLMRLGSLAVIGIGLFAIIYFGVILPRRSNIQRIPTNTAGPSPTFTATPTLFGATAVPTQVFSGPTPLSAFLAITYTPTPLYVNTPHAVAADQLRIAKRAYEEEEWDVFIQNMLLLEPLDPDSADIPYFIGEAYRFKEEYGQAKRYYERAIELSPDFAPAYLGLARINLLIYPKFKADDLFEKAISLDPNFGEIYLERARYLISRGDYKDAFKDLETAEKILPGSPDVLLTYALAYKAQGDTDKALEYAQKAYSANILHLPTYGLLGDLYIEKEEYASAVEVLVLYTTYNTENASAYAKLGKAYYYLGEYQSAVDVINRGTQLSPNGLKKYYVYRGYAQLALGNFDEAVDDLATAVDEDDQSFFARIGFAQALYGQKKFGTAFLQIEAARSLEETDEEQALELYWRARIQEKRNEIRDAIKNWNALLAMDEDAMTPEMRAEAKQRLSELVPPTVTPTPTRTPKGGAATPTPTRTPTKTPKP
ncbi:hypothetical protein MASR2M66_14000 [Chloroflexota bacterium]